MIPLSVGKIEKTAVVPACKMKVLPPNTSESDRPTALKSLRIVSLLLAGVVVGGFLPIAFALAAYVAAVPASKMVVLGDSAASCSVTQLSSELSPTQATVSAAPVAIGISLATRCSSEQVIGRLTVEDLD